MPVLRSLHHHGVGLEFFDQLLGPLREEGALIASANEVNVLALEAFGEMQKGGLEAGLSVANTVDDVGLEVGGADEHVFGEGAGHVHRSWKRVVHLLVPVYSICHY